MYLHLFFNPRALCLVVSCVLYKIYRDENLPVGMLMVDVTTIVTIIVLIHNFMMSSHLQRS